MLFWCVCLWRWVGVFLLLVFLLFCIFFTLATICYLFFSGHIYVGVQKPCVSCPLLFSGFGNFFIMISLNRSSVSLAFVSASSMRIEFILNFCHLYVSQSSWMSFHLCIIFSFLMLEWTILLTLVFISSIFYSARLRLLVKLSTGFLQFN